MLTHNHTYKRTHSQSNANTSHTLKITSSHRLLMKFSIYIYICFVIVGMVVAPISPRLFSPFSYLCVSVCYFDRQFPNIIRQRRPKTNQPSCERIYSIIIIITIIFGVVIVLYDVKNNKYIAGIFAVSQAKAITNVVLQSIS